MTHVEKSVIRQLQRQGNKRGCDNLILPTFEVNAVALATTFSVPLPLIITALDDLTADDR